MSLFGFGEYFDDECDESEEKHYSGKISEPIDYSLKPGLNLLRGDTNINCKSELGKEFINLLCSLNIPYKISEEKIFIFHNIFLASEDELDSEGEKYINLFDKFKINDKIIKIISKK